MICIMICTCLSYVCAKGQLQYRTSELNRLTQALQLNPDSMVEGKNDLVVNGRHIYAQIDNGMLTSLGYCLFPHDLKRIAQTPVLNFLERYFLQLDYPQKDRPRDRMLREDRFTFNKGSLALIATLHEDDAFSFGYENKYYWATWTRNGQELVSVSFPASHELISGENKVESEKYVETDILSACIDSVIPVDTALLSPMFPQGYFIKKGDTYLHRLLLSDLYYQCQKDTCRLLVDENHPLESASNLMLSPEIQTDCRLKIKQVMYGYQKKFFEVPLQKWIFYCLNNGCKLYCGIESFEKDIIQASVIAVNEKENYNHVLFVNIPISVIGSNSGCIEARLETFIPMHNVTNMFDKYRKITKQPKIYEN